VSVNGTPLSFTIDGETLCEKLKELRLGVDTQLVESVEIRDEWFKGL
jgi:restriction system protein